MTKKKIRRRRRSTTTTTTTTTTEVNGGFLCKGPTRMISNQRHHPLTEQRNQQPQECHRQQQQRRQRPLQSSLGSFPVALLFTLFFLSTRTTVTVSAVGLGETTTTATNSVYRYNICNGLSNQLLYHAASVAIAVEQGKEYVEIPNHFIVNGVQHTDDSVLPSAHNSVPFHVAFDAMQFQQRIQELGIRARFVTFDFGKRQIPCAGMQSLHQADPALVRRILLAFVPSAKIQTLISGITSSLESRNVENGICVHHRDGQDWYDHCARWSSIADGIYRGNCLGVPGRSFVESLEDRGLDKTKWVYYCGDHEIPRALKSGSYDIVSRNDLMRASDQAAVVALFQPDDSISQQLQQQPPLLRDLWALIDFYVCSGLTSFIGNSVSTFSAIQIALRQSENSFWYNSQSIPLGDIWRAYQIPIVYTYTELSKSSGKHLLQASIASVRKHMPENKIHILYHGKADKAFRLWLSKRNVLIHQHDPVWRRQIETMRENGDPAASHLFLHSGNYFGTWQRIDIPNYINSEYCLQLDADTIVLKPFTLADFGLDMTYGIAMSSEFTPDNKPANAGVTLMNIPRMRQTYNDFLEFILQHVHSAKFDHPSPSDQGAYLEFYDSEIRFLSPLFNFKPYWKRADIDYQDPFIVHFHGAKPHDYLKHILGDRCDKAIQGLCNRAITMPFLCHALQQFAEVARSAEQDVAYCNASFQDDKAQAIFCNEMLYMLATQQHDCYDFRSLVHQVLERIPDELGLPKDKIERNLRNGLGMMGGIIKGFPLLLFFPICLLFLAVRLSRRRNGNGNKGRHDH